MNGVASFVVLLKEPRDNLSIAYTTEYPIGRDMSGMRKRRIRGRVDLSSRHRLKDPHCMRRLVVFSHEHTNAFELDINKSRLTIRIVIGIELVHLEAEAQLNRIVVVSLECVCCLCENGSIGWSQKVRDWLV